MGVKAINGPGDVPHDWMTRRLAAAALARKQVLETGFNPVGMDRKARLAVIAMGRMVWQGEENPPPFAPRCLDMGEEIADDLLKVQQAQIAISRARRQGLTGKFGMGGFEEGCRWCCRESPQYSIAAKIFARTIFRSAVQDVFSDLFANQAYPVTLGCSLIENGGTCHAHQPPWLTPEVRELALAAYTLRSRPCQPRLGYRCPTCMGKGEISDGSLDPYRLAILSDCLEEAGCDVPVLLWHLRGDRPVAGELLAGVDRAVPHYRGCWVIDLLLGKK